MATKQYDVFLSHPSAEKPVVEFLARKLEEADIRPFLDQWHLIPGEPIQEALEAALDQSATCAVFIGAAGTGPWANEEMRAALAQRVKDAAFRVIPVLLPGVEPEVLDRLPHFLTRLLWVDFRPGLENEDAFQRLLAGIRGHAPKLTRENASPEQIRLACPYRGLSAFGEEDEALFFGRENWTEKLLAMVEQQPFVAVLGASGSGKSSLVQAGLLAKLRSQHNWLIASLRPGEHPLSALAKTLIPFLYHDPLEHISKSKKLTGQLRNGDIWFKDVIEKILETDGKANRFLLVIDQFEELYALCDDAEERTAFILGINPQSQSVSRLKPAISESKQGASASLSFETGDLSPGIHIILTLRSDFLGQTNSQPELSQAIANHNIIIPAMNRDDLRRAIAEPASRAGFPLHDEVVELLLEQSAGREGALPLLEFALTRIWEGLAHDVEAAETLQQIGGVGGALANKAQDLFDDLNDAEQQIARRAFRRMTRLGEGTQDSRRRVNIADIIGHKDDPQQVRRVLNHFAQPGARLITLDEDTAEITHEALFEHWEALKHWLDDSRDDLRFHHRLADAAKHWDSHNRPSGLLWRPPDLDLLHDFQKHSNHDMTMLQLEFFHDSVALQEYEHAEKEKQHQREIEAVQKIAREVEARQKAEEIAKNEAEQRFKGQIAANKRLKLVLWGLVVAGFTTVLTALSYSYSAYIAKIEREKAEIKAVEALYQTSKVLFASHDELGSLIAGIKAGKLVKQTKLTQMIGEFAILNLGGLVYNIHERNRFRGHKTIVENVVFSLDGAFIKSKSADGITKIWNTLDGQVIGTFQGDEEDGFEKNTGIIFSHDGDKLAFGERDDVIQLWNRENGKTLIIFEEPSKDIKEDRINIRFPKFSEVSSVAFNKTGTMLALGFFDGSIKLWNIRENKKYKELKGSEDIENLCFSQDGNFLLYNSRNNDTIQIWDIENEQKIYFHHRHVGDILSLALSPEKLILATGSADKTIKIWDIEKIIQNEQYIDAIFDIYRVIPTSKHVNKVWDFKEIGKILTLQGHSDYVKSVAFGPGGKILVSGSDDGTVRIWDIQENNELISLQGDSCEIGEIAINSDGSQLALISKNRVPKIKLWDIQNDNNPILINIYSLNDALFDIEGITFNADNSLMSIGTANKGHIDVWDVQKHKKISTLPGQSGNIIIGKKILFPSNSMTILLILTLSSKTLIAFDAQTGEEFERLDLNYYPSTATISPNRYLLAIGDNNVIRVWDIIKNREIFSLLGHSNVISSLNFSSNNTLLISKSLDDTIKFWDIETGSEIITIQGSSDDISSIAFSANGKTLVTAKADGKIKVWNFDLDILLEKGCEWLQDYLRNPYANLSDADRAICDDILHDAD